MPVAFTEMPTTFYLGRRFDPDAQKLTDEVVYYNSRDLTTHAVVLGMTGSGKTGMCISILEEAILDNIPAIIIDPKGDITNLLLQFPQLRPQDFRPWINADDAARAHIDPDQYAADVANKWRAGLTEWGIVPGRISALKNAAEYSIYTPGSDAGLPISILASLQAPREGWAGHEEGLREQINGVVKALLALIGKSVEPVRDREHVLIANIFEEAWKNGRDLTLEDIIIQTQKPPFARLGVFDIDTFFPEKDRFKLAMELNKIIASPSFQSWRQGEPLNVKNMLYTAEGRARVSVLYIAHLNEAERSFIVTLLLENMLSWMRTLTGTTSLRALLYFDEVFGYFPPVPYNPPSKAPLLRLLKQARAFGIGLILATQNPVDLDYKGLSNAGTWFIGKLQTNNDTARVLAGLQTAGNESGHFNAEDLRRLMGTIEQRMFVMKNIHTDEGPEVINTRWTMSYLRGPLTRQQVRTLMEDQRKALKVREPDVPEQYTQAWGAVAAVPPAAVTPNPAPATPAAPVAAPAPAAGLFSASAPVVQGHSRPLGAGIFEQRVSAAAPLPPAPSIFSSPPATPAPALPPPLPPARNAPALPPPLPEYHADSPAIPTRADQQAQYIPRSFGAGVMAAAAPVAQPASVPDLPSAAAVPAAKPVEEATAPPVPIDNSSSRQLIEESAVPLSSTLAPPQGYGTTLHPLSGNTAQYFVPTSFATDQAVKTWEQKFGTTAISVGDAVLLYRPVLLAQLEVRYLDRKKDIQDEQSVCYQVPNVEMSGFIQWDQYTTLPVDPNTLSNEPFTEGYFGPLPLALNDPKRLTTLRNEVIDNVYRKATLTIWYNDVLGLYGQPTETKRDFSINLQMKAREARDAEIEKVTAKYDVELERLDTKLNDTLRSFNTQKKALEEWNKEDLYATNEAIIAMANRTPYHSMSRMSRTRRQKLVAQESAYGNEQKITDLEQAIENKQEELKKALMAVNEKWARVAGTIQELKLTPLKKDIAIEVFGVGWIPAWYVSINNQMVIIPAI